VKVLGDFFDRGYNAKLSLAYLTLLFDLNLLPADEAGVFLNEPAILFDRMYNVLYDMYAGSDKFYDFPVYGE
jgi:hypothetical protein